MKKLMLFLLVGFLLPAVVFAADVIDALFVTADSVDPLYATPVIDREEDVETPIKGHIVVGHFEESNGSKFTFFFPSKEYGEDSDYHWDGRFIHSVYPGTNGDIYDRSILMNALCGAYSVADATPQEGGYRSSAAAAKFSRVCAAKYYGYEDHIYGYVYGGSGGGFVTTGCIEGTEGVYDGAVPYVVSTRSGLPYNQCSRVFARAVFKDMAPQIAEALEVGGSGDPYACLSEGEAVLFKMLTDYGVPLEVWKNYRRYLEITPSTYVDTKGTAAAGIPESGLLEMCRYAIKKDPTYWDEFWTNPVYLGASDTPEGKVIQSLAYTEDCLIQKIVPNAKGQPGQLRLDKVPVDPTGVGFRYELVTADGQVVGVIDGTTNAKKRAFDINFDYDDSIFPERGTHEDVWSRIQEGMILRASNKKNLAMVSVFMYHLSLDDEGNLEKNAYHMAQFLNADGSLPDSFRPSNRDWMSENTQGHQRADGDIGSEKIVLVGCMSDMEAYMGSAYYDMQLRDALGDDYADHVRIWWFDNADHMDSALSTSPQYFIAYSGGLIEAINQLVAWVEDGIEPTASTSYSIDGGQVVLPNVVATERGGIQPTVDVLTANGQSEKLTISAGTSVDFDSSFTLSEATDNLTAVRWDFVGLGDYEEVEMTGLSSKASYTYNEPGVYLAAVKVDSQSDLFVGTSYGVSQNFRKVRVVVEPTVTTENSTITFYGNDLADETYGQVYGQKRYYPVSWSAGDKSGEFTANGGLYTAECDGYGEGAVTCDVKVWTGYKWEDADQESFSVQLPDEPVAEEPAIVPAQEAAKKGIPVWLWICLGVAAVTGVVLLI